MTEAKPQTPNPEGSEAAVIDGRFAVRRYISSGGMGAVYEVRDAKHDGVYALKVIRRELATSGEVAKRVLREASAVDQIDSPHVVEVLETGRLADGRLYVLMEYLQGMTLSERLRQPPPMDFRQAADVCAQTARGLIAAHAVGIVHRDIKPDNLFLVPRGDGSPMVKILDFGISKFLSAESTCLTGLGKRLGTYSYMPPEQMKNALDADERSDIYSLGVALYECLAGKPPFAAKTIAMLMMLMSKGTYRPLSELRSDLPAGIDGLMHRCLATRRSERFEKASAFLEALVELSVARTEPRAPTAESDKVVAHQTVEIGPAAASEPQSGWLSHQTVAPASTKRGGF